MGTVPMLVTGSGLESLPDCTSLSTNCRVCAPWFASRLPVSAPAFLGEAAGALLGLSPAASMLPGDAAMPICKSSVPQAAAALLLAPRGDPSACGLMRGAAWGTMQSAAKALRAEAAAEGLDLKTLDFEDAWMTDIQCLIQDMLPGFAASQPSQSFAKVGCQCRMAGMPCLRTFLYHQWLRH